MNPILFNTEMVRAILEDRKTVTRRVVKPQPVYENGFWKLGAARWSDGICKITPVPCHTMYNCAPYRPGDILYVRETWAVQENLWNGMDSVIYRANCCDTYASSIKWRPSIHMPREAARIFLRVTDVRVEKLQAIEEEQAVKEGCSAGRIEVTGGPWGVEDDPEEWTAVEHFRDVWNITIKKADRALYGWSANPWVWVIEFERISREEALANG